MPSRVYIGVDRIPPYLFGLVVPALVHQLSR